jgi:hypothetical protein
MMNLKLDLLLVFPLTRELQVCKRENGFALKWLNYIETQLEIKTSNTSLMKQLEKHLKDVSVYQSEPFTAGSPTHQWLWHYQEALHAKIRIPSDTERTVLPRDTTALLPEHYGKGIMQSYIKEQLKKMENEYIVLEEISVFIGTWNCAGDSPKENIEAWLKCSNTSIKGYDVVVISLQEICELNTMNILLNESSEEIWELFILRQVQKAFPLIKYEIVNSN